MTVANIEYDDENQSIIDLYLQRVNLTEIARQKGLKRTEVVSIVKQWEATVKDDSEARDIARESLHRMVAHYDVLLKKLYDLVDDIDSQIQMDGMLTHQFAKTKEGALKSIADLDAKRVDLLQKAGMFDNNVMGDQLAEMEKQKETILGILRNDLCNNCRPKVMEKIGQMTGRTEVVVVYND